MTSPIAALAATTPAATPRPAVQPHAIPPVGPRLTRVGLGPTYVAFSAVCPNGHEARWSSTRTDASTAMTFVCSTCNPEPATAPSPRSAA